MVSARRRRGNAGQKLKNATVSRRRGANGRIRRIRRGRDGRGQAKRQERRVRARRISWRLYEGIRGGGRVVSPPPGGIRRRSRDSTRGLLPDNTRFPHQ